MVSYFHNEQHADLCLSVFDYEDDIYNFGCHSLQVHCVQYVQYLSKKRNPIIIFSRPPAPPLRRNKDTSLRDVDMKCSQNNIRYSY